MKRHPQSGRSDGVTPLVFAESRAETDACIRTLTSKGSLIRTIPGMSTQDTRTLKIEDRRYDDICGAANNRGDPCKLPAGWGTPGSSGDRCKFHGGLSTGPDDTSHLEDNDFAKDNPRDARLRTTITLLSTAGLVRGRAPPNDIKRIKTPANASIFES
mgnify:CR=1 FL=1